LTVQCGDDIAREDASLRGGAVRERVGDQRAFVFLHTEAFGDVGGDGLDLHADPNPARLRRAFLGVSGDAAGSIDWPEPPGPRRSAAAAKLAPVARRTRRRAERARSSLSRGLIIVSPLD